MLASSVRAAKHGLIVGNFVQGSLYSVVFDDKTFELKLVGNTTVPAPSSWLSWSVSVTMPNCLAIYTDSHL